MGVSIMYESDRPLTLAEITAVREAAQQFNAGRWWLYSEGLFFFTDSDDNTLTGCSKYNPLPSPDETAEARRSGTIISGLPEVIEFLAQTSANNGPGWRLSFEEHSLGFIRNGAVEPGLESKVKVLAQMATDPELFTPDGQ
jgi:hypothetical protein